MQCAAKNINLLFFSCITFGLLLCIPGNVITSSINNNNSSKHPIILVPGDGGSQGFCFPRDNSSSFLLWINLWYFLRTGAMEEYFSLVYNRTTHSVHDTGLCDVRFPGWGDTKTVENLDSYPHSGTVYFGHLVDALRQDPWYVSNTTIRGAPFDFRKAPLEDPTLNDRLKALIEETYLLAGNRPVVLLGHSLGSIFSLAFLKSVSDDWKRRHIKSFISVSGPFGGSIKAMRIQASGDNFKVFIRSPLSFRPTQRSLQSLAFLLPSPRIWNSSVPLIVTPEKNYTTADYKEFFHDIGFDDGYRMLVDTRDRVDSFTAPTGVDEIYCVHGAKLATAYRMIYLPPSYIRSAFPDQFPTFVNGDGDATVTRPSLEICKNWPKARYLVLDGAEHLGIVGDPRFVGLVQNITSGSAPPAQTTTE